MGKKWLMQPADKGQKRILLFLWVENREAGLHREGIFWEVRIGEFQFSFKEQWEQEW